MNQKKQTVNKNTPAKTPNRRHQKLIDELADPNTKSVAEAGRKAGFSKAVTRSKIYAIASRPEIIAAVRERIGRALKHHKITPEEIIGSAVFQMRSSMDDVIDETGSFSIEKARATGAIDLIKKHKQTERTSYNKNGQPLETVRTIEVELMTNQDARKEVANYTGLDNFAAASSAALTDEQIVKELFTRLLAKGFAEQEILAKLEKNYPALDVRALVADVAR